MECGGTTPLWLGMRIAALDGVNLATGSAHAQTGVRPHFTRAWQAAFQQDDELKEAL
jgi:hypothetical protein